MKYKIEAASIFEIGQRTDKQGNPHQEDNIFPAHGEISPADRLFIVCDGMGGHDAGEVASATVCEAMSRSILASEPDAEGLFTQADFDRALDDAFSALDDKDTGAVRKMGTTMALLKLYDGGAFIAWMGDSRVYHIRPGHNPESAKILYRTDDHSLVSDLVKLDMISEEEALTHPQRNVITRALQPNLPRRPRAGMKWIVDIRPGDYFYLCSDGMLETTTDEKLCGIFSETGMAAKGCGASGNPESAATTIDNLVKFLILDSQSNRDNHSAILVRILEVDCSE